ncbi:cytochrome c oxidase assembly protein [Ammoniphilus resinae]|uniref:Membrane protein n=1 Tax=Ammoniphilus resinae TaxID=861532 RepID=A0ABS4GQT6_9BACL|nr:cytochrome c oxidase assembly protein [Ammoniphilus resinae]MBP1932636.1 putative membrane protein [Ammoniphilus resinae]
MPQTHGTVIEAGFVELWGPQVFLFCILAILLYEKMAKAFKDNGSQVEAKNRFLFYAGIVLFYVAKGSPVDFYGHHYLFSLHMVQQSLLYYIIPPLMLMGIPTRAWEKALEVKIVKSLVTLNPLIATFLFNGMFSLYHYPAIFDGIMGNPYFTVLSQILLITVSSLMWWHIISPVPSVERISGLKKIGYIFLSGVLLTPACGLIMFAGKVVYSTYINAPILVRVLPTTLDDQQLGGILMKIFQEIALMGALVLAFFEWYRKENPTDSIDPIGGENQMEYLHLSTSLAGPQNRP